MPRGRQKKFRQHRSQRQNPHQSSSTFERNIANHLPIMVPVTSRAIGFCTADICRQFCNLTSVGEGNQRQINIYQMYRVFLGLFQAKVSAFRYYEERRDTELERQQWILEKNCCLNSEVPSKIAGIINSVGKVKTNGKEFVPFVAPNRYTSEGLFIPQSEHVYLYNLRDTVLALQDPNTPVEYRRAFYERNPIPGTVWQSAPDDPILVNADEVIPHDYNLKLHFNREVSSVRNDMIYVYNIFSSDSDSDSDQGHRTPFNVESIDFTDSTIGVKILLVCDKQIGIKVSDRLKNENLKDYCLRVKVPYSKRDSQNLVVFTKDDKSVIEKIKREHELFSSGFLLGELPVFPSLCNPHYLTRDYLMCCQYYDTLAPKAIPTCVTTRSVGFGVVKIFEKLENPERLPKKGNIYQVYRTCLYLIQLKILKAKLNSRVLPEYSEEYQFYLSLDWTNAMFYLPKFVLNPIANLIDTVGSLKVDGTYFLPVIITDNRTDTGTFIPQSEHVYLYNLRKIVVALADESTPIEHRLAFYENNPIPGTMWRNAPANPVLLNPDDVIPQEYDEKQLLEDFNNTSFVMNAIEQSKPELRSNGPIDMDRFGGKAMLTCNDQNKMRVVDRLPSDRLEDYYEKLQIEGNVNTFHNYVALNGGEQVFANTCLLAERPVLESDRYPHYITKNKRVCVQRSDHQSYISSLNRYPLSAADVIDSLIHI